MSINEDRTVDHVLEFDEFGFAIFKPGTANSEDDDRCHHYRDDLIEYSSKKDKTWRRILCSLDDKDFSSPHQLRQSIIKYGVPKAIRGDLWNNLLDTQAITANTSFDYQISLKEIRSLLVDLGVSEYGGRNCVQLLGSVLGKLKKAENDDWSSPESKQERMAAKAGIYHKIVVFRQIMLDLERSFPTHRRFMDGTCEGKEGRASLFRVLAVYSQYNKTVSYCQGMSYIVGMLLMNMDEEKAFWCLVSLFERHKYLTGYFDNSLSKIQRHASVFEVIMKQRKNKLFNHLQKQDINPLMYLTPWFMALFTSLPCWDSVLFIWDMIILEGVTVIFKVALAILEVLSDSLMSTNEMCQSLPILLHPAAQLTRKDKIVPIVSRLHIEKWEIESIQAVLAEKKEKEAISKKRMSKDTKENSPSYKRLRLQTPEEGAEGGSVSVYQEPPIFHRIVDYITTPFREVMFGNPTVTQGKPSNDMEMVTLSSSTTGQSPPIRTGGCFNSTRVPFVSDVDSKAGIDPPLSPSLTKRGNKRLVSPSHRRSPRLLAKRRMQMKSFNASTSSLVGRSAKNQHSFRVFNTPTPLRHTKFDMENNGLSTPLTIPTQTDSPSPIHLASDLSFTSDVELKELNQMN